MVTGAEFFTLKSSQTRHGFVSMNIQAIISSFILALGAVLLLLSCNDRFSPNLPQGISTFADSDKLSGKTADVLKALGAVLVVIGSVGFVYTIYEIVGFPNFLQ